MRKTKAQSGGGYAPVFTSVSGKAGQGALVDPLPSPVLLITAKSCFKGSVHPREASQDEEAPLKEQVCDPPLGRAGREAKG